MKQALLQTLLALAATWVSTGASAQATPKEPAYPGRPIRLVVPFPPGGTADIQGRILAEKLADRLGQPVVTDNRGGANGILGMEIVARAPADGYTIVVAVVGPWAIHPYLYKLPYDVMKDFAPIIHVATTPGALVVHPSVPAKTVKEFIAIAKQRPLNYATSGAGGSNHFAMELFSDLAGIKMTHIAYKGIAPAVMALISGEVDCAVASAPGIMMQVKAGRARAIAVTSDERTPLIPELPTLAESGVRGYSYYNWWGLLAPARTPGSIVSTLNAAVNKVMMSAETKQSFDRQGATATPMSLAQLADLLPKEIAQYRKMAQAAGMKLE